MKSSTLIFFLIIFIWLIIIKDKLGIVENMLQIIHKNQISEEPHNKEIIVDTESENNNKLHLDSFKNKSYESSKITDDFIKQQVIEDSKNNNDYKIQQYSEKQKNFDSSKDRVKKILESVEEIKRKGEILKVFCFINDDLKLGLLIDRENKFLRSLQEDSNFDLIDVEFYNNKVTWSHKFIHPVSKEKRVSLNTYFFDKKKLSLNVYNYKENIEKKDFIVGSTLNCREE